MTIKSVCTASAIPPAARMVSASFCSRSIRLAARTTFAPAIANSSAVTSPMPEDAPVTIATLPAIAGLIFMFMVPASPSGHVLEINKSLLYIYRYQLHAKFVSDIRAIEPLYQHAFNRHSKQPHPGSFLGSACDNRIKLLADPRLKQERGSGFGNLSFDLGRCIFRLCTMKGQNIQFIFAVRQRPAFLSCF